MAIVWDSESDWIRFDIVLILPLLFLIKDKFCQKYDKISSYSNQKSNLTQTKS